MNKKAKKDIIHSLENNNHDLSFDDLMSRKERRKIKQNQKAEQRIMQDLEEQKQKKKRRSLEETKKASKPEPNKIVPNKKQVPLVARIFLSLTAVGILIFWIYMIIGSFHEVEQMYFLVCSSLASFGCLMLVLAGLMMKSKPRSIANVLGSASLLTFAVVNVFVLTGILTFPKQAVLQDFSNKNVSVAMRWASQNKVTLTPVYDYSDVVDENFVITQNKKGNILARDVKDLEVIVSKGPNYDLEANLPDMTGWDVDEVVKKIKELNLDLEKMNIDFQFHEEKRDTLYEQSKVGKVKRNDEIDFKFSLGKEEDLKPVKLINLRNKEKFDALLWLKRNGIKYEIEYKFDDEIEKGRAISTDPKYGTTIKQSEMTVKVYISKGARIKAPNFEKMTLDGIIKWASLHNININYESEYNAKVKIGGIIRVSVQEGTIIEEGTSITVVTSKGVLRMIDFGDDLTKLRKWASEHGLQVVEKQEFSDKVAKGKVIRTSHKKGDVVANGATIEVVISNGGAIRVPNFIGLTESEARNKCNTLGLDCYFSYVYSSRSKGTIVDQNKSVDSEVAKDSSIVLSVSAGEAPSYSSGGASSTPKPSCKTDILYIYPSDLDLTDPTKTCDKITNRYKQKGFYNIQCSYEDSDNGRSGQVLNSSSLNGTSINSCNPVTLRIKK